MAEALTPPTPPPGFEMGEAPPPPPGFVMGDQQADSANAVSGILDAVRGYAEPAMSLIKKSALPLAGQVVGGIAGTATGGPVGGMAGMSLGAGLGEVGNQMLGITEDSPGDVVAATAMPAVAGVAIGTLKLVGGSVLKAFGGRQAVADVAGDIIKRLHSPKISAEDLYSRALVNSPPIQTRHTSNALHDILRIERANPPTETSAAIIKALEPLEGYFIKANRNVGQVDAAIKDLRLAAAAGYKAGNSRIGVALSDVRDALFADAAASGNTTLREAAKAARIEHSVDELAGILRQAQPLKALQDFKGKNKLFKSWYNDLSEGAQKQIESLVGQLSTAAPSGFSGVVGRSIGAVAGGNIAGAGGAVMGGMLPDAAAFALRTQTGRNFLSKLLMNQGVWDAPKTAALLTWTRAQMAEDANAGDIANNLTKALQDPNVSTKDKIQAAMERDEIRRAPSY